MAGRSKTFLLCHGAWSGGWSWKKMHPLMAQAGHRLVTPTYTGLGEREHLFSPAVDLDTHILDILNVIKFEDFRDVVLLGHSYGGMVATGVADRARGYVSQLIYLDAFVPRDGQSLFDLHEGGREPMRKATAAGDGYRVPPNPPPEDTPQADRHWLEERRVNMPVKCFETKVKLERGEPSMPRSYIYCKRTPPGNVFGQFAKRAKSEDGWRYFELDASHAPNITAPEELMAVLNEIVA